jgi:hypothetical protein
MAPAIPGFAVPLGVALFLMLGLGPNFDLSLLACVVLVAGLIFLWRPGEAPILVFVFLYQWGQASAALFYANMQDLRIDRLFPNSGEHELGAVMALLGLLTVAIGIRIGAGLPRPEAVRRARETIGAASQITWVKIFVVAWIATAGWRLLATAVPGLSQLFLGLASLKWAAFVLLTYATFTRPDGRKAIWFAIFAFEFAISIGGYFSSFKDVFLYTIIGLGVSQVRLTLKRVTLVVLFTAVLLWFAVIWTAVKTDYRAFVRGDETAQVITVDRGTALAKLYDLVMAVDSAAMSHAADHMMQRIMYTEYFGIVLSYVPSVVPHENGALWLDALTRPITPRFLFPGKAIIDESLLTNKYTGLGVSGMDAGTQISLGYVADTYIDFGLFLVLPGLLAVGWALGRLYRWVMYSSRTIGLVGMALAPPMLMPAAAFEISSAKLVGGLFAQVLAAWLVSRYLVPRLLPWMIARR